MRYARLIALLLVGCSSAATIETAYDAGEDAARSDAGDGDGDGDGAMDNTQDAGSGLHRCSVEGCNGEVDAIGSSAGCPAVAPVLDTPCTLSDDATCFYCEPDEEQLSIAFAYSAHICAQGLWTIESLVSACD